MSGKLEARLETQWRKWLKRPHQFEYSTESAQKAKVDSGTILSQSQLIKATREICCFISAGLAKKILLSIAAKNEAKWRLSTQASAWAEDKSKELRNMLRHTSQAVSKSVGPNDRHTNIQKHTCWPGGDKASAE